MPSAVRNRVGTLREKGSAECPKVVNYLKKDPSKSLAFNEFPMEYRLHLRASEMIKSALHHRSKSAAGDFSKDCVIATLLQLDSSFGSQCPANWFSPG